MNYEQLVRDLDNTVSFLCSRSTMYWKGEIEAVEFALAWMRANEDDLRAFFAVTVPAEEAQIWPEIGL